MRIYIGVAALLVSLTLPALGQDTPTRGWMVGPSGSVVNGPDRELASGASIHAANLLGLGIAEGLSPDFGLVVVNKQSVLVVAELGIAVPLLLRRDAALFLRGGVSPAGACQLGCGFNLGGYAGMSAVYPLRDWVGIRGDVTSHPYSLGDAPAHTVTVSAGLVFLFPQ